MAVISCFPDLSDMALQLSVHGCIYAMCSKAVFTQRSLSDLTLDQSTVRSDKVCVNTLNRIALPDLTRCVNAAVSLHRYQVVALEPQQISHKCHNDLDKH